MNKALKLSGIGLAVCGALAVGGVYFLSQLTTIQAGYVGVRVNLYADKGVDNEVVGTGRYLLGINEQMYKFPTFNQLKNYEVPFTFQTSDAMDVKALIGVEYNIAPEKAAKIFQTYRKGVDEITELNLRQYISDALIKNATKMDINQLTQGGKSRLLDDVTNEIRAKLEPVGIRIVKLSWVSDLIYPESVRLSIAAKIEATQRALLRENEVAEAKANADKRREAAKGEADAQKIRAEGEAQAKVLVAQAEAKAIKIKADALKSNPQVVQLNAIEKWDGVLPTYMSNGSAVPFVPVK